MAANAEIRISAKDQTKGTFSAIRGNAVSCGSAINSALGGALAAAGAYLSFRAVVDGINELGHLSDIAQKTNTSVDELTRTSTALNILGIQTASIDQLGKAFDYMQKATGRTGLDGFVATIAELGKIEDPAKRGQEAMRIFGRSGMEFMPLITAAAKDGGASLRELMSIMPGVKDAAAQSGDAAADALTIAGKGFKSIWLNAIGAVCGSLGVDFREAALIAVSWTEYLCKRAVALFAPVGKAFTEYYGALGDFFGTYYGMKSEGAGFGESLKAAGGAWWDRISGIGDEVADTYETYAARSKAWEEERKRKVEAAKKVDELYNQSAGKTGGNAGLDEDGRGGKKQKSEKISNALVAANSNAALRLSILGPSYESEQKKQTAALERIAENTEAMKNQKDGGEKLAVIDG